MEKHVTLLELSKRLKALGVKQESNLYWMETDNHSGYFLTGEHTKEVIEENRNYCSKNGLGYYSAFLASELGEMLPVDYLTGKVTDKTYNTYHREHPMMLGHYNTYQSESMADSMALMLEYLIQNKMITI